MDLLRDGEGEVVPLPVALLPVGRYRIVDYRLDSVVVKVLLQFIAVSCPDAEDVEHVRVPVRHLRQDDVRVLDILDVVLRDLPAPEVVLVQMLQLHVQHRRLYLVKPAVAPPVLEHVLAGRAVVGK